MLKFLNKKPKATSQQKNPTKQLKIHSKNQSKSAHKIKSKFSCRKFLIIITLVSFLIVGFWRTNLFSLLIFKVANLTPAITLADTYDYSNFPIDGEFKFIVHKNSSLNLLEANFSTNPQIEGTFSWNQNNQILTYKPNQNLNPLTTYYLSFDNVFEKIPEWKITTLESYKVTEVYPADKSTDIPTNTSIKINFNYNAVNLTQIQDFLIINPLITGDFTFANKSLAFLPNQELQKNTKYNLKLKAGLKNSAGEIIQEDYNWSFITSENNKTHIREISNQKFISEDYYKSEHILSFSYSATSKNLDFQIYQSSLEYFLKSYVNISAQEEIPENYQNHKKLSLLKQWQETTNKNSNLKHVTKLPIKAEGIYYLLIKNNSQVLVSTHIIISKATLICSKANNKFLVWAVDTKSSQEISKVNIKSYSLKNKINLLETAITDSNGLTYLNFSNSDLIVGQKDQSIMLIANNPQNSEIFIKNKPKIYAYTNKQTYLFNQPVYFKLWLRKSFEESYAKIPEKTKVLITISNEHNFQNNLWQKEYLSNKNSSLSGTILFPDFWPEGQYFIHAKINEIHWENIASFKIANKQLPKATLLVSTDKKEYISKEKIFISLIDTSPKENSLANQEISYIVYAQNYAFPSYLSNSADFFTAFDQIQKEISAVKWTEGKIKLDQNGQAKFSIDSNLKDSLKSKIFILELQYNDLNNLPVKIYEKALIHRGEFSINLALEQSYQTLLNSLMEIKIITKNSHGEIFPNANLKVTLERSWQDKNGIKTEKVDYKARQTNKNGFFSFPFTPTKPGKYRIIARGEDRLANTITFLDDFLVGSKDESLFFDKENILLLSSDKKQYLPGETAKITVYTPRNNSKMLITTNSLNNSLVALSHYATTLAIPITKEQIPNLFIFVKLMNNNQIYKGKINLPIASETKKLNISLQTTKDVFAPEEELNLLINVFDSNNKPLEADLSLSLLEKDYYLSQGENNQDLYSNFYEPALMNKNFINFSEYNQTNAGFWQGLITTNKQGKAEVKITLPNNITSWMLIAKGLSLEQNMPKVGTKAKEIKTFQSVVFEPKLPLYANWHDQIKIRTLVQNFSGKATYFEANLICNEFTFFSPSTQKIYLKNKESKIVEWLVAVKETKEALIAFNLKAQNINFSESKKEKIPIYSLGYEKNKIIKKNLNFTGNKISFTSTDGKNVELKIYPNLLAEVYETIQYLNTNYSRSNEELAATLIPMLLLKQNYAKLSYNDEIWKEYLTTSFNSNLNSLIQGQNYDGGWGWFPKNPSNILLSAKIIYTLSKLQKIQVPIEKNVLENGFKYLETKAIKKNFSENEKLFLLLALAQSNKVDNNHLEALLNSPTLSFNAKNLLALVYLSLNQKNKAFEILYQIKQTSEFTDQNYWDAKKNQQDDLFSNSYFMLGVLLELLNNLEPDNSTIPKIITWLQNNKTGYFWHDILASSQIITTIIEKVLQNNIGKTSSSQYKIIFNEETIASGKITSLDHKPLIIKIAPEKIQLNNHLEIFVSEKFKIHYRLEQKLLLLESLPFENIFKIKKSFQNEHGNAVEKVNTGDIVKVVLAIDNLEKAEFVKITDFIPAGFEPIITNEQKNDFLIPTQTDTYSNRIVFYQSLLNVGTNKFTYLLKAVTPGMFQVNPAKLELLYNPKIIALSDFKQIEIIN